MTREESIQRLKQIKTDTESFANTYKSEENHKDAVALDMAIEALSADAVSREDWSNLVEEYNNTIGAIMAVISAPTGIKEISDNFAGLIKEEQTDSVVRCGKWIFREVQLVRGGTSFGYVCSICGKDYWQVDGMNYCPSCGADMRGNIND